MDEATEKAAILGTSTFDFCWEAKLVTQVLKSFAVDSCIVWRHFERRELLQSLQSFKSFVSFRNSLKKVRNPAEFMMDA